MATLDCWNCGESLADVPLPISRHASCASCFEVLHCCRMCQHYEPNKAPYCDEDRADPPNVKESANFCEYFQPVNGFSDNEAVQSGKAKSKLDNLFDGADNQPLSNSEQSNSEQSNSEQSNSEPFNSEDANADTDDPHNKFNSLFDD